MVSSCPRALRRDERHNYDQSIFNVFYILIKFNAHNIDGRERHKLVYQTD